MNKQDEKIVAEWIRATASHNCTEEEHGLDCALFMDFDMAILGKQWAKPWAGYTMPGHNSTDGYQQYAMKVSLIMPVGCCLLFYIQQFDSMTGVTALMLIANILDDCMYTL